MNIIQLIQDYYPKLSSQEKKIAEYILKNSSDIINISITDLGNITNTSPATITRFTKKIGCESFVDFKIHLKGSAITITNSEGGTKTERDIYDHYTKVISNTREMNVEAKFQEVVDQIKQARKVYVFGVGSSGFTALEFSRRLLRMGIDALAITDSHFMLIVSELITSKDLAIGISISGETKEIITALQIARSKESKTISFTSFAKSELALFSDSVLVSYNSMFVDNQRFINSQFSTMYIIDTISTLLLEEKVYRENMDQTVKTILEKN